MKIPYQNRGVLVASIGIASLLIGAFTTAEAGILGSASPVIIVRTQPSAAYRSVYVIYAGDLSEMITAEAEVRKVLGSKDVLVMGASEDVSNVEQMKDSSASSTIESRLRNAAQPSVFLTVRHISARDKEMAFRLTLVDPTNGKEVAVGEATIDTSNQVTLVSGAAQEKRIAIRDVCRRFLADKRIAVLFTAKR